MVTLGPTSTLWECPLLGSQLLEANNDIWFGFSEPSQQVVQPFIDVVDVESDDLQYTDLKLKNRKLATPFSREMAVLWPRGGLVRPAVQIRHFWDAGRYLVISVAMVRPAEAREKIRNRVPALGTECHRPSMPTIVVANFRVARYPLEISQKPTSSQLGASLPRADWIAQSPLAAAPQMP
jgi:hypothetical protein